jgi:AcrR family transcriptional regulator
MNIPFRLARAIADDKFGPPTLTPKQKDRQEKILTLATELIARHGRHRITMGHIAHGLRISPAALRWHFSDLDALLHAILRAHLDGIAKIFRTMPHGVPDRPALLRAAFHEYTRKPAGGFTNAHLLLIRERASLPEDLRDPIEATYCSLGTAMAADWGTDALEMLDTERFSLDAVEARLTALTHPAPDLEHQPAAAQTPPRLEWAYSFGQHGWGEPKPWADRRAAPIESAQTAKPPAFMSGGQIPAIHVQGHAGGI